MTTAMEFRKAATALETADKVRGWADRGQFGRVRVSWELGSACEGYDELQREIGDILTDRMPAIAQEAIARIQARADAAVAATRVPAPEDAR